MADIFISYASQDRDRINVLAKALAETQGWSVWWDLDVPFGKPFDQVIEETLKNARCVIVAWSTNSVSSGWVIEEAQYGRDREILVPVLLDNVAIPLGFRRLQAAYLVDWSGRSNSPVFQKLVSDISTVIGTPAKHHDNMQEKPIHTSAVKTAMIKAFTWAFFPPSEWKNSTIFLLFIVLAIILLWSVGP